MTVKDFREETGLTQEELAQKLGVTKNYLYMVESGKRNMSKLLQEKFDAIVAETNSVSISQSNIRGDAVNVIGNTHSHVQITPPTPTQEESQDLSVVPSETIVEQLEVVQANNELLQEIRTDQERLKREHGRQLAEVLKFVQSLGEIRRVREIIDDRTHTIIAAANHHIHTQAQVMITAIEGIINMVEAGVTNPDLFLRQLRAVRSQLEKMADFKQ